ncbi:hypothetical protein AtDm6_0619 [Acetobacter tropicalis]|uniref:Uncharacterized protein n=1 Tax=Acetobacter tropicalis TaxID=104102 RepID=A0A094YXK4_9PROT|nr:hypothetical protein AtDm6_0619 [Acetobacter tropicalis]
MADGEWGKRGWWRRCAILLRLKGRESDPFLQCGAISLDGVFDLFI